MENTDLICQVVESADDTPQTAGVAITAVTKLKHAALWAVVKKYGSQQEVARRLKVRPMTFNAWVNLRACPPVEPKRPWTPRRLAALDKRFMKVCGAPMALLFPPELRKNVAFLRSPKAFERTAFVHAAALEAHANNTRDRLLKQAAPPVERLELEEKGAALKYALHTVLTDRERCVIQHRYGLDDDAQPTQPCLTLDEVGALILVTRERVRQIENKAVRKLQDVTNPATRRLREVWS